MSEYQPSYTGNTGNSPELGNSFVPSRSGKVPRMPTDRSAGRIRAFAFGAATLFDITGAVIYRALRAEMPEPGKAPSEGPFELATKTIEDAHSEAVMRATRTNGVDVSA
ncbi:MAG TPA: hypothetical protein VIK57_10505 [Streptosporangiaceae bacterium]